MNRKRPTALLWRGIVCAVVILGGIALLLGVGRPLFSGAPAPTATPAANSSISQVPTPPPLPSPTGPTPLPGSYVTLSGQNFVVGQTVLHPYGATMYPYWSYQGSIVKGEGWTKPDFSQYIDHVISLAQQAHLNVIRATNFFDGIAYGDWYNATVWANMDYLFRQAAAHHLYVLLDLSSFRDRTLKQGIYPYDPAAFSAAFTWVARRYARAPNLLNYAIAGEVSCPNGHDALRPTSTDALTTFYRVLAEALSVGDPYHLISTGGLSHLNQSNCGIDWQRIFALPHIRIAAIHVYSDNDRTITMPLVSAWAAGRAEPFTVEEFGFVQGQSDATRAAEYAQMYALGRQYHATTMIFWNLGDELAPTSYEVNPNTPLTWQTVVHNAPPAVLVGAQRASEMPHLPLAAHLNAAPCHLARLTASSRRPCPWASRRRGATDLPPYRPWEGCAHLLHLSPDPPGRAWQPLLFKRQVVSSMPDGASRREKGKAEVTRN